MDDQDGDPVPPLELSQVCEQTGDLHGGVFIDTMQPYERIEDQQPGPIVRDRLVETLGIIGAIESEGGSPATLGAPIFAANRNFLNQL